jgi:hypothetical protein
MPTCSQQQSTGTRSPRAFHISELTRHQCDLTLPDGAPRFSSAAAAPKSQTVTHLAPMECGSRRRPHQVDDRSNVELACCVWRGG